LVAQGGEELCPLHAAEAAAAIVKLVFFYRSFDSLPAEFRKMRPGLTLLLLIPGFSRVWDFFTLEGLSRILQDYFASIEDGTAADCGLESGMAYPVLEVCNFVPFVCFVSLFPSLVLLARYIVTANELRRRLPVAA
jgi:hypothetical protein